MVERQDYQHHTRLDPLFHMVAMPLAMLTFAASAVHAVLRVSWDSVLLAVLAFVVCVALMKLRQYATKLQDRNVRMEERFRHFTLTGKPLDPGLTLGQIIALRFAPDGEFPALCERAARERLDSDQIKAAVQSWRADTSRV